MPNNKKLLYMAKIVLAASALVIIVASFFFYKPNNYPLGAMLNSQMGQTLVYGGFAIVIALLAWFWPAPGGMISVLYGAYRIFEHIRLMNINALAVKTFVPTPVYFTLYSLVIIGGIICIIAGWKIKLSLPEKAASYEKLRKAARIATFSGIIMAMIYSFGLSIVIVLKIISSSAGGAIGWTIFLSPILLAILYISWKWPAPGGLLTIAIGISVLILILSSSYTLNYKIPYSIFCIVAITGGVLSLVWAILTRLEMRSER